MKRARLFAAATAALTALLLQAALVAPVTQPIPVSLPAVLVCAVALVDGAGAGLAFGFVVGLLADLGSAHPAGVLALCWMGAGLACGTVSIWHSVPRAALLTGVVCGGSAVAASAMLALARSSGASLTGALADALPAALGDAILALVLIPVVRRFLRSESLRAPHPVFTELQVSAHD
jgi:cell shape-determining protein MreD